MLVFIEKEIDLKDFKCKKIEHFKEMLFNAGYEDAFQFYVWFYNQTGISKERLIKLFYFVPQFIEKIKKGNEFYLWFKDFASMQNVKLKKLNICTRHYMPFEKITKKFDKETQALIEKVKAKKHYEMLKQWIENDSKACEGFFLTRIEEKVEFYCTDILDEYD